MVPFIVLATGVIAVGGILAQPAAAQAGSGLIWPSGTVELTTTDAGPTASIQVSNPTAETIRISAPPSGGPAGQVCDITVVGGDTLEPRRAGLVSIVVRPATGCPDPADGQRRALLEATSAHGSDRVSFDIEQGRANAREPDATGVEWPTGTVTVHPRGRRYAGELELVNPTSRQVDIHVPRFVGGADCAQDLTLSADPVRLPPRSAQTVSITVPKSCMDGVTAGRNVTATARTPDGIKEDSSALTLEVATDWSTFWQALIAGLMLAIVVVGLVLFVMCRDGLTLSSPLLVSSDAPSSWLTGIATLGSAAGALVASTGPFESLLGSVPAAPSGLVLAGAATAAGLAGLAGLIANAPFARTSVGGAEQVCPTVWQFGVSSALTAGGVIVQVVVISIALAQFGLDVSGAVFVAAGTAGTLAVVIYLVASVRTYLTLYGTPKDGSLQTEPPADVVATLAASLAPRFLGETPPSKPERLLWMNAANEAATELIEANPIATPKAAPARFTRNLI